MLRPWPLPGRTLPLHLLLCSTVSPQASWESQEPWSLTAIFWGKKPPSGHRATFFLSFFFFLQKPIYMHLFIHFTFKLIVFPGTCKEWRQLNMNCRWESIVIRKVIGTNFCHSNTHYTVVLRYCSQITSSGKYKLRVRKSTAEHSAQGWMVPSAIFSAHTQLGA